jgi:hypothetical protein
MQGLQNRSRKNFDGRRWTKTKESVESENRFEPGFYIIIDEVIPAFFLTVLTVSNVLVSTGTSFTCTIVDLDPARYLR